MTELPDCLSCGACCAPPYTDLRHYVAVESQDRARLPESLRPLVVEGELATRPREGGVRCVALEGRLGEAVLCAIHPQRPQACRRFRRGSIHCHAARREVLGIED